MNRTIFLIDGFNVYHSIKQLRNDWGRSALWLDLNSLCNSFLSIIGGEATFKKIYYFSAFATHLINSHPNIVKDHKDYIKCLEATGVVAEMGRFKPKDITCPVCANAFVRHEEKETDVAIAVKLCELLFNDECDTVVIVTGDTDLAPAIRHTQIMFPLKKLHFAFPYKRKNKELAQLAPSFNIKPERYFQHLFNDPFELPDKTIIHKPPDW